MNQLYTKLEKAILEGRALHAYLLSGSDPAMTDEAANNAASLMLYGKKDVDKLASEPDYMEYEGSFSIGEFREVIRPEIYRETYGKRGRVLVLRSAHQLSPIVQNAMLKVLEEPPENTHFILTGNEYGILPTIRSRCMIIRFSSRDLAELEAVLLTKGASKSEASRYAAMCGGNTERAIRLYEDESFRKLREEAVSAFVSALKKAPDFKWTKQKHERTDMQEANEFLLLYCHDMMQVKCGGEAEVFPERAQEINNLCLHFTTGQIGCIIDKLIENAQRLATNAPAGASFDRLFCEISLI